LAIELLQNNRVGSGPMSVPVNYTPNVETPSASEDEAIVGLRDTLRTINETTLRDGGHRLRSVHAKSHALLSGEMEILSDLPAHLAQGLFAKPGRHPVVMRISTNPGDILPDSVSLPRGLALKVGNVEGPRLAGSEAQTTQDFLLVNGPTFGAPDAAGFLKTVKLVAKTTDKAPGAKQIFSAALRGVEHVIEAFGGQSGTVKALGGHPMTHPLGETYFSQTAFRFGDYIAKFSLRPATPELRALHDKLLDVRGKPDGLREGMIAFFSTHGGEWEFCVQLCTDLGKMPVEDATVLWPTDESPYVGVARVKIPKQTAWSQQLSVEIDDQTAFNPWQGLEAHRPLGSVNRARKASYEMSVNFRHAGYGCPIKHA
jgi:hypothetical protein